MEDTDSPAFVEEEAPRVEQFTLTYLVLEMKYPRGTMADLWAIVNKFHIDTFPILL